MKYKLSIGTMFKNEGHIMYEWIHHYLNNGIDHFYLVDNDSNDNYHLDYFDDLIKAKKIDLYKISGNGIQNQINNFLVQKSKNETEYLMILDLDEFMYSPRCKSIKKCLDLYFLNNDVDQIIVPWYIFSYNYNITQPLSAIESFTKRMNLYQDDINSAKCKSIFKPSKVKLDDLRVHIHNINNTVIANNDKTRINSECLKKLDINIFTDMDIINSYLVINHYKYQSLEFHLKVKSLRGDCQIPNIIYPFDGSHIVYESQKKCNIYDYRLMNQSDDLIKQVKKHKTINYHSIITPTENNVTRKDQKYICYNEYDELINK